jgi:hypothetical protein
MRRTGGEPEGKGVRDRGREVVVLGQLVGLVVQADVVPGLASEGLGVVLEAV